MEHFKKLGIVLMTAAIFIGCDTDDEGEREETVMTGDLDATRMVAMGNSLTAGIIDGGWTYDGLQHSYATQIARQIYGDGRVGDDPAEHQFLLGRIKDPGNPVPAQITDSRQVGRYEDGTPVLVFNFTHPEIRIIDDALRVENQNAESSFNNLAVPGFTGLDVLQTASVMNVLGNINPLISLPLRNRGSQMDQALEIDPSFVMLWIGNNEALGSALSGGTKPPYPDLDSDNFPAPGFHNVLNELLQPFEGTDTRLILGTVPDVTSIPFITEIGVSISDGTKGYILNLSDESEVWNDTLSFYGTTPDGDVRAVLDTEHVLLDWLLMNPFNENPPRGLDPSNPLSDTLWLTAGQLAKIEEATDSYNHAIISAANRSGNIAVADINAFFNQIIADGGIDGFDPGLFGGLFSLDGVHPGKVGHAYIANEFIKVLNETFGARIAKLNPQEYVPNHRHKGKIGLAPGQANPAYKQTKKLITGSGQRRFP